MNIPKWLTPWRRTRESDELRRAREECARADERYQVALTTIRKTTAQLRRRSESLDALDRRVVESEQLMREAFRSSKV